MLHGKTFYRCGCLRFVCPCHPTEDSMRMTLNSFCPEHGGPADKVQAYEEYDHVLDGGKTERRVRKSRGPERERGG